MNYSEISFKTESDNIEKLSNLLYANDILSFSIEDYNDILEYNKNSGIDLMDDELLVKCNGSAIIKCYFNEEQFDLDVLLSIESLTMSTLSIKSVEEEDWANNWKSYFKPIKIGENIIIKPTWDIYDKISSKDIIVEIDPGMAFGTGTHETTSMCIIAIEKYMKKSYKVLDIGCGSGIIGITSLKLGAYSANCIDLDENAVKITLQNAKINKVYDNIEAHCSNLVDIIFNKFNIIVANIVANAIIELSCKIPPLLATNGIFIASGIIKSRYNEVKRSILANNLLIIEEMFMGEWVMFVCKKS